MRTLRGNDNVVVLVAVMVGVIAVWGYVFSGLWLPWLPYFGAPIIP